MGNRSTRCEKLDPEIKAILENSNYTLPEIMVWYDSLKERYPSGKISMEEFKQMYKEMCSSNSNPEELATLVFRLYDTNNSGFLSFREYICGVSMSSFKDLRSRIEWIFKLYDLNADGFITPFEMKLVLQSIFKINPPESPETEDTTPAIITEKIFAKYDSNGDAKITKEELFQIVEDDPELAKLLF